MPSSTARRVVTVFGASGFLGRHIVQRLGREGAIVRAVVRDVEGAAFLKPMGEVGQIIPLRGDVTDPAQVARLVAGASQVINLVGILYERGKRSFEALHVQGAKNVAQAAKAAGVQTLLHISALGADAQSDSAYARSKAQGEEAVKAAFPEAVILRPSVVFGPDDDFFNRFAKLAVLSPVLPVFCDDGYKVTLKPEELEFNFELFGQGGTKFQPVFVGDVADAAMAALAAPSAKGKIFELAGPRTYSMKELFELICAIIRRDPWILPVPFFVGRIQAAFLQFLPTPPLTPDQVKLLKVDNVASGKLPGLTDLGVQPKAAEVVLPTYLTRYRPTALASGRA
jgi:uncharacterized protein YbjT (DUF2867 family)